MTTIQVHKPSLDAPPAAWTFTLDNIGPLDPGRAAQALADADQLTIGQALSRLLIAGTEAR